MSRWSGCPRQTSGPDVGELWRHYKGDLYLVLSRTQDSENYRPGYGPNRVVYQLADGSGPVWDRPGGMWQEEVELHSYHSAELDQGVQKPTTRRFIREAEATTERRFEAIKRFIAHDLGQVLNKQFVGSTPALDQELADANAKGLFGPDAKGRFEPTDDPKILTWRVTIPLPIPSEN